MRKRPKWAELAQKLAGVADVHLKLSSESAEKEATAGTGTPEQQGVLMVRDLSGLVASTRCPDSALRSLRWLKQLQSLPGRGKERFPAREISGILGDECGPSLRSFQRDQ